MKYDKAIYGAGVVYTTDSTETGLNNNAVIVGTSGCGKTKSITEARLAEAYNTSLIITVTKRRLVDQYRPELEKRGYEVHELNFVEPERGDVCYDPFMYIKSSTDVEHFANAIMEAGGDARKQSDPYWSIAGKALLTAEIAAVKRDRKRSLDRFVKRITELSIKPGQKDDLIETSHDMMFAALGKMAGSEYIMNCWNTFRSTPIRTASCIYSVVTAYISNIFTEAIVKASSQKRQVDISSVGKRKKALFIVTSPVNVSMHRYVNLFYAQVFKELFEYAEGRADGTLPVPVHIICDDFATGGRVENFAEYISIFREKGISVTLLLQSESQLSAIYGTDASKTIINNCDTYVYMGGMDVDTCKSMSIKMDVPIGEIMYMPVGKEYVLRRGEKPMLVDRYDIFNNKTYKLTKKLYDERIRKSGKEEVYEH